MKSNTVGGLFKENILRESFLFNSGSALETISPLLDHVDGISFILAVSNAVRVITANGTTDHVVSGTRTWTLSGGNFGQGDVGGTFVIAGSVANNGSYVIQSVTNATTVVSVGSPVGNETFTTAVTATLTDLPLQATPTVSVSNNYVKAGQPSLNQNPNAGKWADITSGFSPAPAAIAVAGNQYFQASPLVATRAKLILTPTAGASYIDIYYSAKGSR